MLLKVNEVKKKINDGELLHLAADEKLLQQLPKGNWVGGTIPYFMNDDGGKTTKDEIFVTELNHLVESFKISWYDENNLIKIVDDAPDNGFSIVIIPATSKVHIKYAQEAPEYPEFYYKQLIGWISGVHLDDLGNITPKVINGSDGELSDQKAIVLHVVLPKSKAASIGIINIFSQGNGDTITFNSDGFTVGECEINGNKQNFADYLRLNNVDLRFPLVANYNGANINVSFQAIDEENNIVNLYAPVFKDTEYKLAIPSQDYLSEFQSQIPKGLNGISFSCNCILNYLYSELEGKKTSDLVGPITFGEIAYQLLNQTFVYLRVQDV